MVAPAVPLVAIPVVAPSAQQGFPIGLPVTPQRSALVPAPVLPPVLPQPVLPAPRGPLPCQGASGTLVHATTDSRQEYHFSWCNLPDHTFSHEQATDYCRNLPSNGHPTGFRLLSIEDQAENSFITDIISSCEYFSSYLLIRGIYSRIFLHNASGYFSME